MSSNLVFCKAANKTISIYDIILQEDTIDRVNLEKLDNDDDRVIEFLDNASEKVYFVDIHGTISEIL